MSRGAPSIEPPDAHADAGLPGWVLPVSLVGLALLLVSTLPALVARRRLERGQARMAEEVRAMEEQTDRVNRDRQALLADEFVMDVAMRELLEPGPRTAAPRLPTPTTATGTPAPAPRR